MRVIIAMFIALFFTSAVYANDGYPIPGRVEGTSPVFKEKNAQKKSNASYPSWYRGNGKNGLADEDSLYFYRGFIGPKVFVKNGFNNEYFYMGTLELKPDETYPAHNHPSYEIYYIIEGEAEWYVDDEKQTVGPGSVIFHRPYAVHGWTNLSKDKPLKAAYIWWSNGDPSVLSKGARFTDPDLFKSKDRISAEAIPTPKVRMNEKDKVNPKYGEYPVPGRLMKDTAFVHFSALPKISTKSHPEWIRGKGKNGLADKNAIYHYKAAVGPSAVSPAFENDNIFFGFMEWSAGSVYPAHNHPAPEFYYILSGEAEFYSNDLDMKIGAGDFIYTTPYDVHGWKVLGKEPLTMIWAWWVEDDATVMDVSAKMINLDLAKDPKKAVPYAVPRPEVQKKSKDKR